MRKRSSAFVRARGPCWGTRLNALDVAELCDVEPVDQGAASRRGVKEPTTCRHRLCGVNVDARRPLGVREVPRVEDRGAQSERGRKLEGGPG